MGMMLRRYQAGHKRPDQGSGAYPRHTATRTMLMRPLRALPVRKLGPGAACTHQQAGCRTAWYRRPYEGALTAVKLPIQQQSCCGYHAYWRLQCLREQNPSAVDSTTAWQHRPLDEHQAPLPALTHPTFAKRSPGTHGPITFAGMGPLSLLFGLRAQFGNSLCGGAQSENRTED